MTLQGEQTTQDDQSRSGTTRFTVLGREFALEATFAAGDSAITTGLYENGRLIFSGVEPALDSLVTSDLESGLANAMGILEAQIKEMFAFLREVEEGGSSKLARLLAEVFESRGLDDEAERLYGIAVDLDPSDAEGLYLHGLCLTKLGDYVRACERLGEAVSQKPLYADYRNAYGLALAWSGKVAESRKQLEHAIELNTYYADAQYSSGLVCLFNGIKNIDAAYAQGFVRRAKNLFEKATLIDSTYITAEYQLGLKALDSGSVREAFSHFRRNRDEIAARNRSSYEDRRTNFLAALQSSCKQTISAQMELLRRQLEENPHYVDISFQLALAYFRSGMCEWQAGIDQLKSVLELNPDLYKAVTAHDISFQLLAEMRKAASSMESSPENRTTD